MQIKEIFILNNHPLISIGIPTYNRPIGLEKTINCFIKQTYFNLEIIISDNNSEDLKVQQLCKKYSNQDSRIRYFRQKENIGMYENFKFVLQKAKGKYFMWASDDDVFYNNFIEETLKPFFYVKDLVLCSPICKVMLEKIEVNKYNADFQTLGLKKLDRIKKILLYIKKSHTALYGLYETSILKKINIYTFIDCDGLILLELSQYGFFFQLNKELMNANFIHNENNTQSLTMQKEKLIDTYNMKPKFFLMNFEKITLFFFLLIKSFKWKRVNLLQKLTLVPSFYNLYFSDVYFLPFSVINNFLFFLQSKKMIGHFSLNNKSVNHFKKVLENQAYFDKILITYEEKFNHPILNEIISLIKVNPSKFSTYSRSWENKHTELQYSLGHIKIKYKRSTHFVLINNIINNSIDFSYLKVPLKSLKFYNKCLKYNNEIISVPIRKYIHFVSDNNLSSTIYDYRYNE